ncbi:MAG: hypothetical protein JO115_20640 [Pseudonocardiales bacterium]|nr:hypothetical protein [Pseudonocardiales bacterium]
MDYPHGNPEPAGQPLPRTIAEGVGALGRHLACPVGAAGASVRIDTRYSERSPDTEPGWADAVTLIYSAPPVRVTTERRDRRDSDLATAARESLSGSWPAAPAHDLEAWLLERTATLNTVPTLPQAHAATVEGNAYPGIRTHPDTIAAWAIDLGDVRISASGPATVLNQLDIELRTTNSGASAERASIAISRRVPSPTRGFGSGVAPSEPFVAVTQ